jgi:predicted Ser/Thr protein kinase
MLPGYEVSKMIGRGGMGAVYLGRQISLDREVAIKILPQHLEGEDGSFVERFKNEARAMARMNHPGIVAVYDFGWTESGLLYFVMEFIEGTDVQHMISQQRQLPPAYAHSITAHVCEALAYAHERGLIHRDIKPANIMLSRDGEVKVADFGLAKAMDANVSNLTQSGMVLGTLHYMAPESFILGAAVDHRADIYAVGVMLYQMLTGRLPQGVFKLPSEQVEGLDPRFDEIIAKAMREEREQRYQSAREMRQDLDALLTRPLPMQAAPKKADAAPAAQPAGLEEPEDDWDDAFGPLRQRMTWLWTALPVLIVVGLAYVAWNMISKQPTEVPALVTAPEPAPAITPPAITTPAPATKPAAVASAPVVPPKPSVATPSMPPAPQPEVKVTLDFPEYSQLLQTHAANWQTGVQKPYDDGMTALKANFAAALQREHTLAKPRPDKTLANAYAVEMAWFQREAAPPPPAGDDPLLPPRILQLRQIFRAESARLQQARETTGAGVRKAFTEALAGLQTKLEAAQQTGHALAMRQLHGELIKSDAEIEKLLAAQKIILPPPVAATQPVASAVPAPPITASRIVTFEDTFDTLALSADWKQQGKAWNCTGGVLWTSKVDLKEADDAGWGCWLARELPAEVRVEFDAILIEEDAVLVCELFSKPGRSVASSVVGYRFRLGDAKEARPLIYRGMSNLPTESNQSAAKILGGTQNVVKRHVSIQCAGGVIIWEVDGRQHASATDPKPLQEGWLGFHFQGGTVLIDNLTVRDVSSGLASAPSSKPATAANAQEIQIIGHVFDIRGRPAAQTIVRGLGMAVSRTDDMGRYALRGVPSDPPSPNSRSTSLILRAESPGGETQAYVYTRRGSSKVFLKDLSLEKLDTIGIRWVLQTKRGDPRLEGDGTMAGEAYFSNTNGTFDLRRGGRVLSSTTTTSANANANYDFRLYAYGRKVTFQRDSSALTSGWHKEDLPFDQIVEINQGKPFSDKDYFVTNGIAYGTAVSQGDVFTARCAISGAYAKIEIIHVPD